LVSGPFSFWRISALSVDCPLPIIFDGETAMGAQARLSAISSRDLSRRVCIELHPHQPGNSPDLACPICNPDPAAF